MDERKDDLDLARHYLATSLETFRAQKSLAERATAQLSDDEFFRALDPLSNSVGVIVKHTAGNLRSRWRDFLTSDGEKPERDRDGEFELEGESREALMRVWETGWQTLFDTLAALRPEELLAQITIRGQPHTALEAITRALAHAAQHSGQIVQLAKHWRGEAWETLSIPRKGGS